MKALIGKIEVRLTDSLRQTFGSQADGAKAKVGWTNNPAHGDLQSNVALTVAKQLKSPPRTVAEKLVQATDLSDVCQPPEIAGPGFINLRLHKGTIEAGLNTIKNDPRLGIERAPNPKKVIVEYSSPNIAKEMHVGHLRSTIIGDCLARVYSFLGHDVLRLNHVGDWGTQFGMLITHLKDVSPGALTKAEAVDIGDLVTFYRQAKKRFDEDKDFQDRARSQVVALQAGEQEATHAWKLLCRQSEKEFQKVYDALGVLPLEVRGESFYNPLLKDIVSDLKTLGLAVEDQGAICVWLDGYLNEQGNPLPQIIQKKDGGYNYATSDLAALRQRLSQEKSEEILYVVGAPQIDHLAQVFQTAKKAGWLPETARVVHVPFGSVLGEDGKMLKTRAGETVRLIDLLSEAVERAGKELEAKLQKEGRQESKEFKEEVARVIGIAAVRYAELSFNRMTDYTFSFDKMLSLAGNTAPYMLYAYVRIQGISRKGNIDLSALADSTISLDEETELALAKHLLNFDETIDAVIEQLLPNRICEYLFELSQKFNQFYEACPVLNAEEPARASRLLLCDLTARTIKLGLSLLGIPVLERM